MLSQIYVRRLRPPCPKSVSPIILIPGNGLTGATFETTPDGRPGWAQYFAASGHTVYVIDQPGRGRSAYQERVHGPLKCYNVTDVEQRFTASEMFGLWPEASLHTQWPGTGLRGDPIFNQFYASLVPFLADRRKAEQIMREIGPRLLQRVGPAILVTHSQSGPLGWQLADASPHMVRAIVAIEPSGPPFVDLGHTGPVKFGSQGDPGRLYGLTRMPLLYDPPLDVDERPAAEGPRDMKASKIRMSEVLDLPGGRRLVNVRCPTLVVTGQASHHASYDAMTAEYLHKAGVEVEHMLLAGLGIRGNGHFMMLESNSEQIASAICSWISLLASKGPSTESLRRHPDYRHPT